MDKNKVDTTVKSSDSKVNDTEQFTDINDVLKVFDDIRNWFVQLDDIYSEMDKEEREQEDYHLDEEE